MKIRTQETEIRDAGKTIRTFKNLTDTMQEDNSEKQLSIILVKYFFWKHFGNENKKALEILMKHKKNIASIINGKISSINQS